MKDISRREFLKYLGVGTVGLIVTPKLSIAGKKSQATKTQANTV